MKLPLPFGKKEQKEYFLALLLRDEKVSAVIFEEFQKKITIVAEHEEYFKDSIEDATLDEWLDTLDKAISTVENKLPENAELKKTIFGVTEQWVEETKIKKEYLSKLKKISDDLELSPIGFLVIHEAITHLLKQEEGAPPSGILTEVGRRSVGVSLVRAGKVVETRQSRIEDSASKTVDKLLNHFTGYEVLPARIILLDRDDSEHLAQEFIAHAWSRSLPFLHVPQITTLPKSFDARAIIHGAATQMGFEVLQDDKAEMPVNHPGAATPPEDVETSEKEIIPEPAETEEQVEDTSDKPHPNGPEKVHVPAAPSEVPLASAADFGFVMNKDVTKDTGESATSKLPESKEAEPLEYAIEDSKPKKPQSHHISEYHQNVVPVEPPPYSPVVNRPVETQNRPKPKKSFASMIPKFSFPRFPALPSMKININKKLLLIPPLILLLCIGIVAAYIMGVKATVTLNIQPKVIEQDQKVTFSTDGHSDFSNDIVEAKAIEASKNGDAQTDATGKKEVGDKAKGTITLYSRFTKEMSFASGTPISGPNNLEFTLDKEVKVASSSADASASPSTAKVTVTAKNIGKEYNLPSGSKFSVGTYDQSDIVAKNEGAFSGGSKKEITVVAKADIDKLLADLPKQLEKSATEELSKKLSADEALLPILANPILSKKDFDKNAGEEAKSVTLQATVSFNGISYKKQAILDYSDSALKDRKEGLMLAKDGLSTEVKDVKETDDHKIDATVHIKAALLPKIDEAKIAQELAGKSVSEAKEILSKLPQVSNVTISLQPNISFLPQLLPRLSKNIQVISHP